MATTIHQRRPQSETDIYHVYSRGNGRQLIYETDDDRCIFLDCLSDAALETETELFAYCLMGNHYHLIVRSKYDGLPKFAHALNRSYAVYFNTKHDRAGHLFQDRYSSEPIEDDSYFLSAIRYVHRNPVEAGIVSSCDYAWSSYSAYIGTGNLVARTNVDMIIDMLGGVDKFVQFHSHPGKESFIDDAPLPARMSEAELLSKAHTVLGGLEPTRLKALPKRERDAALRRLRQNALSIAQVCLITGISHSTVQRAL